ncbi:hypothetical protein LOK49_LG08G02494 [Camellia lanceoleosa]|uniref:Uncharacterized protein n=1 Tax=Camellia lanceoleosa TaxID=1840588 RepID=A0ACC0GN75_9ERIC|nr:hypothetical protein LOK49_LG08G02494 [Camellia lanceoleosa]
MAPGSSGSRNGKRKRGMRSSQTSTKLASKRQAKLPFKKQRGPSDPVQRAAFDPSKLMYRSNISGVISTVQCAKLVETLTECHNLKLATAAIEPKECDRIIMDVDPPEACDEHRTVIETVDVGSIEPSFNCWQAGTKNVGTMNTGTPTSKEKLAGKIAPRGEVWPILFPDLLELSSTPDGEGVGQDQRGATDELVIDVYVAMLTEMHKTVSGRSEYVGTSYIYTSVCSTDMWQNEQKQWMSDHHNQYVKPRVTAAGVRADLFDGSFVSVVDCPQQVPESSDCGIFVCFIIRQYIRGAKVNTMMDGLTPTGLRAAMVDMFLSDSGRGLRGRTL